MNIRIEEKVDLATQLKVNRIKKGYSREELSIRSGVSENTIDFCESGRIKNQKLETIIKLSQGLNIPLEELIVSRKVVVV